MAEVMTHARAPAGVVILKTLRDQRRALVWWSIGMAGLALMYIGLWPAIRNNAQTFNDVLSSMPAAIRNLVGNDFATPAGYLRSELFTFMGPIVMLVYGIGSGARAIAGEERAGTLDLLLSTPARRRTVAMQKAAAMVGGLTLLAFVLWLTVVAIGPASGLHIGLMQIGAGCANLLALGIAFGSIALALGAALGARATAVGVTGAAAVAALVIHSVTPSVPALRYAKPFNPFRYYAGRDPLTTGFNAVDLGVLLGIAVVALVIGIWRFEHRDLAT